MATINSKDVERALSSVDFPAAKDDIVTHAEQVEAPEDVQRALRSLPPVDYDNAEQVLRSVRNPSVD